jgi:tetratricopeptide (TPR) repeat protein
MMVHAGVDIDAKYPAFLILAGVLAGLWYDGKLVSRKPIIIPVLTMIAVMILAASLYESDALANKGLAYEDAGYYEQAATYFGQAHSGLVYNPGILVSQGINYYTLATSEQQDSSANLQRAAALAKQAQILDPYDAQNAFLLARVLTAEGKKAQATVQFKTALHLDPYNQPMFYGDYAQLLLSEGKLTDAEMVATAGIEQYPPVVIANRSVDQSIPAQVSGLYVDRAAARWESGHQGEARSDVALALKVDPSNQLAQQLQKQFH